MASIIDQPTEAYDTIISSEVIEHLYPPEELASFAWALLRLGGSLVISTPYHGHVMKLALSLLDEWPDYHTWLWQGGHIKFYSHETLTRLLEKKLSAAERFVGAGRSPYLWKSMVLVRRKPEHKVARAS